MMRARASSYVFCLFCLFFCLFLLAQQILFQLMFVFVELSLFCFFYKPVGGGNVNKTWGPAESFLTSFSIFLSISDMIKGGSAALLPHSCALLGTLWPDMGVLGKHGRGGRVVGL